MSEQFNIDPQLLAQLEEEHKASKQASTILLVGALVGILTIPLFGLGSLILICSVGYYIFIGRKAINQYRKHYKETILTAALSSMFDDVEYHPMNGFTKESIRNTDLFQRGNVFKSEDFVKASYHGVPFTRADVLIQEQTTDSEGNTHTTTYFDGTWAVFPYRRDVNYDICISTHGMYYTKSKTSIFTKKAERRHKVETENMEFNKQFNITAQKDSELFYVLTPPIMEALMRMARELGKPFIVAFIDGEIHFCLNDHRNTLEPHGNDYDKIFAEVHQDMDPIIKLIETLRLS